jgi:hypothetical protein
VKAGFRKATIALTLALLLAVSLAGSALARPLIADVESYGTELVKIHGKIDSNPADRPANHGYFVSELASNFEQMLADAGVSMDGLTKGQWISLFARWMATDETEVAMERRGPNGAAGASAAVKPAQAGQGQERAEQARANRAQGEAEQQIDEPGAGRVDPPGLERKPANPGAASRPENPGGANVPENPGNAPAVEVEEEDESRGGPPDWVGSGPPQAGDATDRGQSSSRAPR